MIPQQFFSMHLFTTLVEIDEDEYDEDIFCLEKEHRDTKTLIISGHSVSRPKETNMINIFSFRLRLWQVTYWIRLIVNNEVMKVYLETYCFCSYTFWRIIFTLQSVLDIINMIFPKKYINLNYIFLFSENEKCNIQHWVESITSDAIFNLYCFLYI